MASPNISFETLPSSIRKPGKYFEFNTKLAVRTLPANTQRVCIIAPKTAEGALAPLTPTQVYSDAEARIYGGPGSIAHLMVLAAIKAHPYLHLTLMLIDDAEAGIAATGTVTITGSATAAGVLSLSIGDVITRIAVARGDSAADSAAALAAAVSKEPLSPVTADSAGGVITLTARNKGAIGNSYVLATAASAEGLSMACAPMAGGQVDASLAPALNALFAGGHNIIISPYTGQDQLTELREHLNSVSHALEQRGCVGVAASTGTLAQGCTLAGKINSGRIVLGILPGTATPPYVVAAALGAMLASEEDPAVPLNTLKLLGVSIPPLDRQLGRMEQETALYNGLTPLEAAAGDVVQIVRALSTYIKDPQGIEDVSLLDITTIRIMDYVGKACRERISLRFPRAKLSSRTPPKVRSELIDVLLKLEELEIVENVKENLPGLIVERDTQDNNRLNAKIPVDVVNGLHVFAGRIDLLL